MYLLKLDNGMLLQCYDSDNRPMEEDCDCSLGYNLFNADGTSSDGGEFDYNSKATKNENELLSNLIEFAIGEKVDYEILHETSECAYEELSELLEEEFDLDTLEYIANNVNDDIKAIVEVAIENVTNNDMYYETESEEDED